VRLRLTIVVLAALLAVAPTPHAYVERMYATGVYASLQPIVTGLSNRVPFAVLDALIVAVVFAWITLAVRDARSAASRGPGGRRFLAVAGRIASRTLVWCAGLYLLFLVVWGLNYRRTPLVEKLPFDTSSITENAARTLALTAVERLNALHAAAHAAGWPARGDIDPVLAAALARADRDIGGRGLVTAGRPKATMLDWYFHNTATDGMTDPYFLETLVSTTLLPFERPFVFAHEWSHLAGLADEGEANFLAWLACVRASPPSQYSGWLFLYAELAGVLPRETRGEVAAHLAAGPRADLTAIRERVAREINPRIAAVGRRVYDSYLKANRIEAGVASYGRVVQLILGVRFGPEWTIPR
jgi:hypothetical protein